LTSLRFPTSHKYNKAIPNLHTNKKQLKNDFKAKEGALMDIEKALKNYKKRKSIVETIEIRIEAYERMLIDFDDDCFQITEPREPGMPHSPNRSGSPTEKAVILMEVDREGIKEIIKADKSRLFWPKLEIEQIDKALEGLTTWEKYIIEIKYYEGMSWRNIEISFNKQFPQRNDLTEIRLKQINGEGINKLKEILSPFYIQYESMLYENYTKTIRKLPVSHNGRCYTVVSGNSEKPDRVKC
jgi:hypothetical protein